MVRSRRWEVLGRALVLAVCVGAVGSGCKREASTTATVTLRPATPMPYPGPPTIAALELEFDGTTLVIRNVTARRDDVRPFKLADHLERIREGDEALFEYRAIARDGSVVGAGQYTMPLRGVAAYQVPGVDHVAHQRTGPARSAAVVGVPLKGDVVRVEIDRLTIAPGTVNGWTHVPAGRVDLPASAAPQPSDAGGLR